VSSFRNPALKQLTDQQVRFAPPARRLEQLARAERLLCEIDHGRQYPYQFVCYRITEFRPDSYPDLLIDGRDLEHDLFVMIDCLGRATPAVPVESVPEPVLTLEQISKRLNVSTKTISRWRHQGLMGARRALFAALRRREGRDPAPRQAAGAGGQWHADRGQSPDCPPARAVGRDGSVHHQEL
jgi:hypothetical protein